jgi:hypothetical protein
VFIRYIFYRFWYHVPRKIWQHSLLMDARKKSSGFRPELDFMSLNFGREVFGQIFSQNFRTNFYPKLSDKFLSKTFGQIFIQNFRTNIRPKLSDKFPSKNST